MSRLTQAGLVRVVAMVEPVAMGLAGVIAFVSIRADRAKINEIHEQLGKVPDLVFIAVCVGSSDLSVAVTAADPQQLTELVSSRIQTIDGVQATDTLFMVDVVRFSPYLKRLDPTDA